SDEPVPPTQLQPKTPRDLETICLKCLQKEPAKRYRSAQGLAEDLRRLQAWEPIAARPVGSIERAAQWVGRRRTVAGLLGAVALLAVLVPMVTLFGYLREAQLRTEAEIQGQIAREAEGRAQAEAVTSARLAADERRARQESRRNLYLSNV